MAGTLKPSGVQEFWRSRCVGRPYGTSPFRVSNPSRGLISGAFAYTDKRYSSRRNEAAPSTGRASRRCLIRSRLMWTSSCATTVVCPSWAAPTWAGSAFSKTVEIRATLVCLHIPEQTVPSWTTLGKRE